MKKLLVILLCCFSTLSLFAQYLGDDGIYYDAHDVDKLLAIQLANPQSNLGWSGDNFHNWYGCYWVWDDNKSYKYLWGLSLRNSSLTSLDVGGCVNIQTLQLDNNPLNSLDISGCVNLSDLEFSYSSLTSLDISGYTNLKHLWSYANPLASLNVEGCTNLNYLYCPENQLESLDVTGCINLEGLLCHNNQLMLLDVSGCMKLEYLYCPSNLLMSLNFNRCVNLKEVDCSYNQLSSLNFRGCINLAKLQCNNNQLALLNINGCINLEDLSCYNNQLISLDFKGCTKLKTLSCSYNQLTSLNTDGYVNLRYLGCNDNQLNLLTVGGCVNLESLSCFNNKLEDDDLVNFYGLNIAPLFFLYGNIGFTEAAIRKLADNLPNINYEQIIWNPLPAKYAVELLSLDDKKMRGVAADEASQLKIRLKCNQSLNVKNVKIGLINKDNVYNHNEAGSLGDYVQGEIDDSPQTNVDYLDYIYNAPYEFNFDGNQEGVFRNITARIVVNSTDTLYQNIMIIRPPVLLVHGLDGDKSTFAKMANELQTNVYSPFQIYNLDYSYSNTASFYENSPLVPFAISTLLEQVRRNGYEAKRADVVGHSMGGLLTRQYVQSDYYTERNDVNRLITLNTPHSGSQGANLIMDVDNSGLLSILPYIIFLEYPYMWVSMNPFEMSDEIDRFVRQGAVRDLCVNSDAITKLNNKQNLHKNSIKVHALYTTADTEHSPFIFTGSRWITLIMNSLNILRLTPAILYGESNDLVVAQSSQIGGVSNPSFVPHQMHTSTNNNEVINRVKYLLNSPKSDFSLFGYDFNPPTLTYSPILSTTKSVRSSSEDSSIKISSIDKPQCTNNEEIKINITGSADITKMSLLIQGEYENIYMETKEGSSNEFTYVVPESALGYKKLLAIGYTDSQTAVVDTASIHISTQASLLYIDTDEKELWLPLSGKQQVYVNGLYSDGTYKNITFMDNVRFEIKGNNAGLESPNIITGEKEGVDTLLISCQGFETALPIRIVEVEDMGTVIVSPDVTEKAETQTLKCYPNPAREQVIIQYELPEQASSVTISVYDIKGQIINKIQPQNIKAGLCEELIHTENLAKGMYIVVLSTDKGNRYAKLLKE
jgi:uncharacterized alpha/beta hydrolase family protein